MNCLRCGFYCHYKIGLAAGVVREEDHIAKERLRDNSFDVGKPVIEACLAPLLQLLSALLLDLYQHFIDPVIFMIGHYDRNEKERAFSLLSALINEGVDFWHLFVHSVRFPYK